MLLQINPLLMLNIVCWITLFCMELEYYKKIRFLLFDFQSYKSRRSDRIMGGQCFTRSYRQETSTNVFKVSMRYAVKCTILCVFTMQYLAWHLEYFWLLVVWKNKLRRSQCRFLNFRWFRKMSTYTCLFWRWWINVKLLLSFSDLGM